VIAREWQWLQPLRSFCELHGIPVQMAREESAQFWRQRDTQWLLDWLYDDAHSLVNGPAIAAGLAGRPASPVRAMLDEAAAEYTRETGVSLRQACMKSLNAPGNVCCEFNPKRRAADGRSGEDDGSKGWREP
jgi:hypothetical protein